MVTVNPASLRTNLMVACDGVAVVVDEGKVSDIISLHICRVFDTVSHDLSLNWRDMVLANSVNNEFIGLW